MKITIFGLTLSSSWGNGHATPYRAIIRALAHMGHEVSFYEKDVDYYARHRDFSACDYCDLVLYRDWAGVRAYALADAAESDAVIVGSYCPEGAQINADILQLDTLRVFYDLDTPITLQRLAEGGVDYLRPEQMPEFDLYLSFTGGRVLAELEQRYGVRMALPIYGCVDADTHSRQAVRADFACDLSYMGTYAADRQDKLEALFLEPARRLPERSFTLAGSLYPRHWQLPPNVRRFEHVSPHDHAALYSSSRATLNITRAGMARGGFCPSGRFFEAAACGTPILTDWFEGIDTFFTPGEEILVVRSSDDVVAALEMSDAQLAGIAEAARERTLREHTGDNRARELLHALELARTMAHQPRALQPTNMEVAS